MLLGIAYLKRDSGIVFRKEKRVLIRDLFLIFYVGGKLLESVVFENIVQEFIENLVKYVVSRILMSLM